MGRKFDQKNKSSPPTKIVSDTEAPEGRRMFSRGFLERRDLEQYFWTDKTIDALLSAVKFTFDPEASCCLCTPSLADAWWTTEGIAVSLLDIDTRFNYLPKFHYFDLRRPADTKFPQEEQDFWRVIVFDPPFFYISLSVLYEAVLHVSKSKSTKLLLGFLKREEQALLQVFKEFDLKRTSFPLEYSHVKPNKWINYALYSNIDMPGIKRINAK